LAQYDARDDLPINEMECALRSPMWYDEWLKQTNKSANGAKLWSLTTTFE
jgi:hypothetical protein